jgi:diguanylate cyclase (GGDEF)-like protein
MAAAKTHSGAYRSGPTAWLVDPRGLLPAEARLGLIHTIYGSFATFLGATLGAVAVSLAIAVRLPHPAFIIWAGLEIVLALAQVSVLIAGRRATAEGREGPTDLHLLLALARAMSIGFGMLICMTSGDWVVACLACLSGTTSVGEICFRSYAAPRLVAALVAVSLGPCLVGALLSGETILVVLVLQIPLAMAGLIFAARQLNHMTVRSIIAERDNDRRIHHDPLTGALNRSGLGREVARRIGNAAPFTLFYLDLDGFKGINDSFGHRIGDALLKAVADRLKHACPSKDAIARIGGDEFVIVSEGATPREAERFGRRLAAIIADEGFLIGCEAAFVGASIGAALFPDHGTDLGTLLGEADAALYRAKFSDSGRCVIAGSTAHGTATPPRHDPEISVPWPHSARDAA